MAISLQDWLGASAVKTGTKIEFDFSEVSTALPTSPSVAGLFVALLLKYQELLANEESPVEIEEQEVNVTNFVPGDAIPYEFLVRVNQPSTLNPGAL